MFYLNQFVSFLLICSLIFPNVSYSVSNESDEVNPYEAPIGTTCISQDQILPEGESCCPGLELNPNNFKCDEPTVKDSSLVSCTTAATCPTGTACYPQRSSDLFSALSPGGEDVELNSLVSSQASDEGAKATGASCEHSRECSSYSCVNKKCENKMVCRFAGEGEMAASGVKCGGGLVPTPSGICALSTEAQNGVYLGLINEVNVTNNGQCRFEVDEETRKKSLVAMKSLRAMEWLFANISVAPADECFRVLPLLKETVGKTYVESRKNILANFTDVLNQIETDFQTLVDAKEKSTNVVSIHGQEIVEGDLATRQTSGYDSLLIMYRRNLLFQSYEQTMLQTVQKANTTIKDLSLGQATWGSEDTKWKIGNQVIQAYDCSGSKYKKWKPLKWRTKYYHAVKDRWSHYYEVTGSHNSNASVVNRDKIANHLALIGGMSKEAAVAQFTKSKYYLLDPLLHAGLKYDSYGESKKLSSSGFLGLGKKDLRKARYLKGTSNGSYTAMYGFLKQKVRTYYGSLQKHTEQKNFVFEPELVTVAAKDCIKNPGNPKCEEFDAFLEEVLDQGFAQFLAYSASDRSDYSSYFTNATTWRRRLLAKLEVDMQNISTYYEKIIELRDQQNACIEKVVNGVIDHGILADGSETGTVEGQSVDNKITSTVVGSTVNALNIKSRDTSLALRPQKLSPLSRGKYKINLDTALNKTLSKNTISDNLGKNIGGSLSTDRAGVGSEGSSSTLAVRQKQMLESNNKARKLGVNLAAKEKAISDSIKESAGQNSKTASGFGLNSGSLLSNAFPGGKALNSAGSGEAALMNSSKDLKDGDLKGGAGTLSAPGGHGIGNGLSGIDMSDSRGNPSTTTYSDSEAAEASAILGGEGLDFKKNQKSRGSQDSSGLNGKGNGNDEADLGFENDNLFKQVSKAYVRNLDKVLTRKKID